MTGAGLPRAHPYLPNTDEDRRQMLQAIGVGSVDELFDQIPPSLRLGRPLQLPPALSEMELRRHLESLAEKNGHVGGYTCFLGGGMYDHYVPALVDEIISRGEFYTSYTPYQPEISQGNLQVIYEFQTMICELTGMDVANASLYDGASAMAEAVLMAVNVTRRERIVLAGSIHPEYRMVVRTYAEHQGLQVEEVPARDGGVDPEALEPALGDDVACVCLQVPNFYGVVEAAPQLAQVAADAGALLVVAADPISLGILQPPGAYGADIVVGEGQALGNPMSYGGPSFGFLAAREKYLRRMPGRIAGATVDLDGNRGYVLALQTREQHIRRERATSNICTNQALNALAAAVYMTTVGKTGLQEIACQCLQKSHYLAEQIGKLDGFELAFPQRPFFKEFVVRSRRPVDEVLAQLRQHKILGGVPLGRWEPEYQDCFLVAVTEKRRREELDEYAARLGALA